MKKNLYIATLALLCVLCMLACSSGQDKQGERYLSRNEQVSDGELETGQTENATIKGVSEVTYEQISQEEAKQLMAEEEGYLILDVRTQEEYADGHIPGAICVPNESISEEMPEELPDKEQLILVYCRSGNRSKQAAQKLAELGYTNVKEFGGIMSWDGEIEQ